ncbi:MAG: type VI secretion system lipoprotein TssJ [Proteobacteria bacterium]|nr:type VI secretion system lipoprotein TssJ [Pseudomonadota bacterium]
MPAASHPAILALPSRGCGARGACALLPLLLLAASASCRPTPPSGDEVLGKLQGAGARGGPGGACEPPPIEIFLQASEQLNPNADGQSMPVEVRVLLLRDRQVFDQLDFETVWQRASEALGRELLQSVSFTAYPGKLEIFPLRSHREATYVALVAVFRESSDRRWQHVVDLGAQSRRCADKDALHTIVHAQLQGFTINEPEAVPAASEP